MNREFSGDIFKTVQEILVQGGIEAGEAKAEANLIITEISGLRIEEILAGKSISDNAESKILETANRRAETGTPIQH